MPDQWSQEEKEKRRAYFESLSPKQKREYERARLYSEINDPNHNSGLAMRARKRMDRVDAMPEDVRQMVYKHGLEIVWEFWTYNLRRAEVIDSLITHVQTVEHPYSNAVIGRFIQRGIETPKQAKYLIDTILGADFANGQPRFKLNKSPNAKQNPANHKDDDEAYYVLGSIVTAPLEK